MILLVPSDYTLALNATVYYADIFSDYPLNTPVFRIRAIVRSNDHFNLFISLSQTAQINDIFEFDDSTPDDDRIDIAIDDLIQLEEDVFVFDATINLVQDPATTFEESDYPVNLDVDISLVGLYPPSTALQRVSRATGVIRNAPGILYIYIYYIYNATENCK